MKYIAIVAALLMLVGCGKTDQLIAHYTGFSKACVEGVSYIQFTSGVTVQYSPDGKIVTCSK